jgi:transposase-like protein
VRRDLVKRGVPTPVTITSAGAVGLTKALAALWPKARRIRCGLHQMQNLQQQVPPQAWPECKALVIDRRDAPTVMAAEQRRQASVSR